MVRSTVRAPLVLVTTAGAPARTADTTRSMPASCARITTLVPGALASSFSTSVGRRSSARLESTSTSSGRSRPTWSSSSSPEEICPTTTWSLCLASNARNASLKRG